MFFKQNLRQNPKNPGSLTRSQQEAEPLLLISSPDQRVCYLGHLFVTKRLEHGHLIQKRMLSLSLSLACRQTTNQNWLLVSEPGFSGFGRQLPLKNNFHIKKNCREWSEQLDMVDTDHFGIGIL